LPAHGYVGCTEENIELEGNAHGRKPHIDADRTHNQSPHPYNQPHFN
jgi:hypothetical protein